MKDTTASFPVSHLKAIGFALLGFALWVFSDTSMKLAGESSLPPYEIVTFLGGFGVFFMVIRAASSGKIRELWPRSPQKQLGRALLALLINLCNALAFKHIPLTLFYVTVFTAPLMISVLASIFLHEKLDRLSTLAILAGFIGVVVAINPFNQTQGGDWIGYLSAFGGVLCFAATCLWLRVMTRSESPDSIAFFGCFVELVLGGVVLFFHAEPVSLKIFLILGLMGLFGVVGNVFNYLALKHTTAATVSQFHYTQIITGSLLGYLIWHEVPTWNLVLGAVVIMAAGFLVATRKRPHQENLDKQEA